MSVIEEIVRAARNAGASDVHITVGIPPKMRVNGSLITMSFPRITAKDTRDIARNYDAGAARAVRRVGRM